MTSPMNIFSYEDCQKYDALAMNVYLEQGKATNGKIQLELCSTPMVMVTGTSLVNLH